MRRKRSKASAEESKVPRRPLFLRQCEEYLMDVRKTYPTTTTEGNYRKDLVRLSRDLASLGLPQDVRTWDEDGVQRLRAYLIEGYAPITISRKVSAVNGLLMHHNNMVIQQLRAKRKYRLPTAVRGLVRFPEKPDVELLISSAKGTLRMVLVLASCLGLRRKEIAEVRVRDIQRSRLLVQKGKGMKSDVVDLVAFTASEVQHYLEVVRPAIVARARAKGYEGPEPEELLVYSRGKRLSAYSTEYLTNMVTTHASKIGLEASPHDFRRGFATELWRDTRDLLLVRDLLRHKDVATTLGYINPDRERQREALARISPTRCTLED